MSDEEGSWQEYHKYWELGPKRYAVGDIVSRAGEDRWRIIGIDYAFKLLELVCIKGSYWCDVGDDESNLIRRYELIENEQ